MSAPLDEATLAEVERLLEEAIAGEWRLAFEGQDVRLVSDSDPEIAAWTFAVRPWEPSDWDECDLSTQRLIVALRNHAPALLAEARERAVYAAECDRLRAELLAWTLLAGEWEAVARQCNTAMHCCAGALARVALPATTNGRAVLLVGDDVRGLSGAADGVAGEETT